MRLAIDTNVFVSAALKDASWPAETLRWLARYGGLLKSAATEHEVKAVLARHRLAPKITSLFLDQVSALLPTAEQVAISIAIAECRDPKDDKFLELAVNGHADVTISGDADLLVLDSFRDIPIITPAAFARARIPSSR
jgi:putative PIN family toxin of toxin-antitoxin system